MSADPARAEIDLALCAWAEEPQPQRDESRFNELALRIFAYQFQRCRPYARLCEMRRMTPEKVSDWREIPAVPTGAFKEMALRSFSEAAEEKVFRTSGTSDAAERRGALHLDTVRVYEASALSSLRRLLFPDLPTGATTTLRTLAPSPQELPDSSLSHMFGLLTEAIGDPHSGYDVVDGELVRESLQRAIEQARREDRPVALLGTAFAFVHWLDGSAEPTPLPTGSRIMETGGFKGRSRTLTREALHAGLSTHFGVPLQRIVNQYGMTELGSQFYDSVLVNPSGPRRKLAPPWAAVRIVDPLSGAPVAEGQEGMLVIHDLANTGSVAAISTADLGRTVADGFEVIGRAAGAEARGCSIAADLMLGPAS